MKREMRNSGWFQVQCRIKAYLDGLSERVNELPAPALSGRRLQGESQVELDALLPFPYGDASRSVLDRAFRGEL